MISPLRKCLIWVRPVHGRTIQQVAAVKNVSRRKRQNHKLSSNDQTIPVGQVSCSFPRHGGRKSQALAIQTINIIPGSDVKRIPREQDFSLLIRGSWYESGHEVQCVKKIQLEIIPLFLSCFSRFFFFLLIASEHHLRACIMCVCER